MGSKLYHGAAYYPELWDEKTIEQDIKYMKEVGINVVRIGEFLWSKLEPEENKIDISFLKNIINRLYENGIETIVCTPTVTPPIWLSYGHPERMHVDYNGTVMNHGSRQHVCTNNPYFRERARIIVEHIAMEVGKHPGVILWQLDNEIKSHVSECMCESCKNLWHEWLKKRYKTIDNLNEKWGTMIWSEYYQSFEQVPQPLPVPFLHNSSLSTMYRIFSMEKTAEFVKEQAEIIRRYSDAPITTNGSIGFYVNIEKLYENLDVAGYDSYAGSQNFYAFVVNFDLWRNVKKGKKFWLLETSPSHAGALNRFPHVHPNGYLRAEAVAAYSMGSNSFIYWLWRQHKSGSEQIHGAVLSAWGKPTVGYKNVLEVEKARKEIESIILSTELCQPELAITYSDTAKAFLFTEPHRNLNYRGLITGLYRIILNTGIHRDLILEGDNLEGYKLLLTPFMHYVSDDYLKRALAFVEKGGIWIVGPLTGGRTEEHTIHTDAALGKLESIAGVETAFTYPMDGTGAIGKAFGLEAPLAMWSAVFETAGASAVGIIEGGLTPGYAFITEHKVGKGKIVMLGSLPFGPEGEQMIRAMIMHYAEEAGITLKTDVSEGTIVAPRRGDGFKIWVIINMDGKGGSVTIPSSAVNVITGRPVPPGKHEIGSYEYEIIRFDNEL